MRHAIRGLRSRSGSRASLPVRASPSSTLRASGAAVGNDPTTSSPRSKSTRAIGSPTWALGEGYFLPYLREAVGPDGLVYAVEVDPDKIRALEDESRGADNLEVVAGELDDPKLPEGELHLVLVVNTYHHIEGRERYFARLRRALAPDAVVAIIEPDEELRGVLSLFLDDDHASRASDVPAGDGGGGIPTRTQLRLPAGANLRSVRAPPVTRAMSPPAPALWNNRFYAALGVGAALDRARAGGDVRRAVADLGSMEWGTGALRGSRHALVARPQRPGRPGRRALGGLPADRAPLRVARGEPRFPPPCARAGWQGGEWEASAEPLRAAAAGALALPIVPLLALMVDRDVSLYLRRDYWVGSNLFIWLIGAFATWHWGILLRSVWSHATLLSARGAGHPTAVSTPSRRTRALLSLRFALRPALVPPPRDLGAEPGSIAAFSPPWGRWRRSPPWVPAWRCCCRCAACATGFGAEKQTELGRIDAAIAGNPGALHSSALRHWNGALSLADLLAYRSRVEEIREWSLGRPTFARFALYLLIPVGSWLGGAFVERIVDAFLD